MCQDDLLHEALTVWETLYFTAMLRLPEAQPKEAKRERVRVIIDALGIGACQSTIIGARGLLGSALDVAVRGITQRTL